MSCSTRENNASLLLNCWIFRQDKEKRGFFLQCFAAALWRGRAGFSEPCPVILPHMSSSAKHPGAEQPTPGSVVLHWGEQIRSAHCCRGHRTQLSRDAVVPSVFLQAPRQPCRADACLCHPKLLHVSRSDPQTPQAGILSWVCPRL